MEAAVALIEADRLRVAEALRIQAAEVERSYREAEAIRLREEEILAIKAAHDEEIERLEMAMQSTRAQAETARRVQDELLRAASAEATETLRLERENAAKFRIEADIARLDLRHYIIPFLFHNILTFTLSTFSIFCYVFSFFYFILFCPHLTDKQLRTSLLDSSSKKKK